MTSRGSKAQAFVLHDDRGNIAGVVIPGDHEAQSGVRSAEHCVSVVELPGFPDARKLDEHVLKLIKVFRVDPATSDRPARLVRKRSAKDGDSE